MPSELFSKPGEVIAARRSNIKPKNVDMILFLNKHLLCFGIVQWFIEIFVCLGEGGSIVWYRIVSYRYTMLILSIVSNRLCLVSPTSNKWSCQPNDACAQCLMFDPTHPGNAHGTDGYTSCRALLTSGARCAHPITDHMCMWIWPYSAFLSSCNFRLQQRQPYKPIREQNLNPSAIWLDHIVLKRLYPNQKMSRSSQVSG